MAEREGTISSSLCSGITFNVVMEARMDNRKSKERERRQSLRRQEYIKQFSLKLLVGLINGCRIPRNYSGEGDWNYVLRMSKDLEELFIGI